MSALFSWISVFDTNTLAVVQSIGPAWYPVAWVLSAVIGSLKYLAPAVALSLFIIGKKRVALEICVIFLISLAIAFGLKAIIAAPRPMLSDGIAFQYEVEKDYGMPSAHALLAVVVFGWVVRRHPRSKLLSCGAVALIFLIGLSRVYLGVHFPSQVVIGWLIGIVLLEGFKYVDRQLWSPFKKQLYR
jgi:membrane-associated phospholipid phosphatase